MKVSSSTVMCLLASSFGAAASKAFGGRLGLSQAKSLLSKAVPVTRSGELDRRRLNDELSVTIYDSILFNSCLTLTTSLTDKVMETLQNDATLYGYWQSKQIVTTHSYVLFSICQTGNCTSSSDDELLVVDLESYMNLAGYRPDKTLDYCEACVNSENYCLYTQYQTTDDANGKDQANGGRKLANNNNNNNKLKLPVNCTTCQTMGCFDSGAATDDGQVALEDVVTWVEALSQCKDLGVQWNGVDTYGQFMCNSKGNGVEIGIFLDNECTVYTSLESYGNLFQSTYGKYINYSASIVTYPFLNPINCAADVEWVSPENYDASDSNADEVVDDKYAADPNEYCYELAQSKMLLPLDNCNYKKDDDAANNNNDDGMFSGYSYDIANNDIDDGDEVCWVIYNITHKTGSTVAGNVANKNVFNSSNTLYNYQTQTAHSNTAGRAVGITFLVLAVVAALGFVGYKAMNAKKDSKKQPLVESQGGALA